MLLSPESPPGLEHFLALLPRSEHSACCMVRACPSRPPIGINSSMKGGAGDAFHGVIVPASNLVPATFVVLNKCLLSEKEAV